MGDSAREYHAKQAKLLIPLMKSSISTTLRASQNNALRLNEINHLRGGSYRGEYQPIRPVRQSRNHGRKAVNPYSNIGQIRAALPSGVQRAIPTNRGLK